MSTMNGEREESWRELGGGRVAGVNEMRRDDEDHDGWSFKYGMKKGMTHAESKNK
jgi:hypothetical protein